MVGIVFKRIFDLVKETKHAYIYKSGFNPRWYLSIPKSHYKGRVETVLTIRATWVREEEPGIQPLPEKGE